MKRVALALSVLVCVGAIPAAAQKPDKVKDECRAVGLLMFDVATYKITVVPQRIEVSYPQTGEFAQEICLYLVMVGNPGTDKLSGLVIKDFEKTQGVGSKPLFKVKRIHGSADSPDFLSIEFNDVPDWDPGKTGHKDDVRISYRLAGKFKGNDITFDPEIIIKKPGG